MLALLGSRVVITQQRPIYTYHQVSEIPPHSVHAQMLMIQTWNHKAWRRLDGAGPAVPYDNITTPPQRIQPQLTSARLVLAGVGVAVFAAVLTITKSGGEDTGRSKRSDGRGDPRRAAARNSLVPSGETPSADDTAMTIEI